MKKSSCFLSQHVFFCLADEHYVFLDLRSDEYLCLGRAQTDEFKDLLNSQHLFDESSAVVQTLLENGLLVENETCGKRPAPQHVDTASASLIVASDCRPPDTSPPDTGPPDTGPPDNSRPEIGPVHVRKFFAAAAAASWNLRWQPIEHAVRLVERRKLANRNVFAPADSATIATIVNLFTIFQTLRSYYPRPYLCLFDSLALIHFLARFGLFPQWVYGVKLEPWGAHCWVQAGDLVVNDIIDNVNGYTPIMSV